LQPHNHAIIGRMKPIQSPSVNLDADNSICCGSLSANRHIGIYPLRSYAICKGWQQNAVPNWYDKGRSLKAE